MKRAKQRIPVTTCSVVYPPAPPVDHSGPIAYVVYEDFDLSAFANRPLPCPDVDLEISRRFALPIKRPR